MDERSRARTGWAVCALAGVALLALVALAHGRWGPGDGPVDRDGSRATHQVAVASPGLVFGCPDEGGLGASGFPSDATLTITPAGWWNPTVSLDYLQILDGLQYGEETRHLDVDLDGIEDLAWGVDFSPGVTGTNLEPLWDRVGGAFPGPNGPGEPFSQIRVTFARVAAHEVDGVEMPFDTDVAPIEVRASATFAPDPQTPPLVIELGYDTRPTLSPAPTLASFEIVQQEVTGGPSLLGARITSAYREGGSPTAPLVPAGTEPPLTTSIGVGATPGGNETLDLDVAWDRAPGELAFVDATACDDPEPSQTLAWDLRDRPVGEPAASVPPSNAALDLVTGKGQGVDGRPELDLHGSVTHLPEELTMRFTEQVVALRHQRHPTPTDPAPLSEPRPTIDLDALGITSAAADPGDEDSRLLVSGTVEGLPPVSMLDVVTDPGSGDLLTVDLRFCDGPAWPSAACQSSIAAAGLVDVVVTDLFPGVPSELPPLPVGSASYLAYTSRDIGGQLTFGGETHFRLGGRLAGLEHLRVDTPHPTAPEGVQAELQLAEQAPSADVLFDTDTRRHDLGPDDTEVVSGSKVVVDGTVTPLPTHVRVEAATGDGLPTTVAYHAFGTQTAMEADVSFRGGTDSDFLDLDGAIAVGGKAGLPGKAAVVLTPADPSGNRSLDFQPSGPTALRAGLVMSDATDRAEDRRTRLWVDTVVAGRVVADWRHDPFGGALRSLDVRPCKAATCPGGVLVPHLSARLVTGPPTDADLFDPLAPPVLPDPDHPELFPAFTATPQGFTYVETADGRTGIGVDLGPVQQVRYQHPTGAAYALCLQSATPDDPPEDKRFGTRVFLNRPAEATREGGPPVAEESLIYVDGVLEALPATLDVRLDEDGAKADDDAPWLWLNTHDCTTTVPPSKSIEPDDEGLDYKALVRAGNPEALATMTTDPLGAAPMALAAPDDATPRGATVRALVDGTRPPAGSKDPGVGGIDVAAHLLVPRHLVVYRPTFQPCDETEPLSCQALPVWTREERLFADVRVNSTLGDLGALDVAVRSRAVIEGGPVTEHTCTKDPGLGTEVCDLDIAATLDHVPGKFRATGLLRTSTRLPELFVGLDLQTETDVPQLYPAFERARIRVEDDEHPAVTGAQPGVAGTPVPVYDVDLGGIDHDLMTKLRFQGTESLPPPPGPCPDEHAWRGPVDLGYVHAMLDVGNATTLEARARIDVLGRFEANLIADQPVSGRVRSKIENVAAGMEDELIGTFSTTDIDLCVDLDLPFEVAFDGTTDARIGVDKTAWALTVPNGTPGRMTLRFGEQDGGTWLPGGVWFHHDAHFDPEGPGDWDWSSPGRRTVELMPNLWWQGSYWKGAFRYSKSDTISTGDTFFRTMPSLPDCCVANGTTSFTVDLFWNDDIRDDMYCRDDDDGCYISFPERPGFEFHKAVWRQGHLPPTGPIGFGELQATAPGTWASYTHTWLPPSGPGDPETSAVYTTTGTVLTGADGTRYSISLGLSAASLSKYLDDGADWTSLQTVVTLVADYPNGVRRWQRTLGLHGPAACGYLAICTVSGSMELLPSGHLLVDYELDTGKFAAAKGQQIFDSSGYGSTPGSLVLPLKAEAGVPTAITNPIIGLEGEIPGLRKFVYFGDGSSVELAPGQPPSVPVPHTYAFPGRYAATIVYYRLAPFETWTPWIVLPHDVTVT